MDEFLIMEIDDVAHLAEALEGVRRAAPEGLAEWRYHGRLVARQLDDAHVVIRADFDYRDSILRQFPGTFSVPIRYVKHMMVVADLAGGDAGAIEDALVAAWEPQRDALSPSLAPPTAHALRGRPPRGHLGGGLAHAEEITLSRDAKSPGPYAERS